MYVTLIEKSLSLLSTLLLDFYDTLSISYFLKKKKERFMQLAILFRMPSFNIGYNDYKVIF